MKINATIFAKLTMALALAGTMAACNQNKGAGQSAQPVTAGDAKIVFVNGDSIAVKYEYSKDMRKRLDDKNNAARNDVGSRQQALQREAAEYQKDANTMSADQRSTTEQRLQREGQEFQQYSQNASAQLQSDVNDESKKQYDKIYAFTKQYAKDNGYKMVLTFQSGNTNLLFADPSLDVTPDFIKKLNDAYAKEKK